jgi:hypothetical protein
VYYDPSTGHALWIDGWQGAQPILVNASLEQFTRTVQIIIDAFPFSEGVAESVEALPWDDEERIAAEERDINQRGTTVIELLERLREIDPTAMVSPSHWGTFLGDIELGHYSIAELMTKRDS